MQATLLPRLVEVPAQGTLKGIYRGLDMFTSVDSLKGTNKIYCQNCTPTETNAGFGLNRTSIIMRNLYTSKHYNWLVTGNIIYARCKNM